MIAAEVTECNSMCVCFGQHEIIFFPGTTALLAFMAMHPDLIPNRFLTQPPYEEVQFFSNDSIYAKGVAFYNEQFPDKAFEERGNAGRRIFFEKSATYFDSPLGPRRAGALVPSSKLIVVLREPMLRALSWYHVNLEAACRLVAYSLSALGISSSAPRPHT